MMITLPGMVAGHSEAHVIVEWSNLREKYGVWLDEQQKCIYMRNGSPLVTH